MNITFSGSTNSTGFIRPAITNEVDVLGQHYIEDPSYVGQTDEAKQAAHWNMATATRYATLPPEQRVPARSALASLSHLGATFDYHHDVMPPNHDGKVFHPNGVMAKAHLEAVPNTGFNGLLAGARLMIRLSEGIAGKNIPGLGVLHLVTGYESVGAVAIHDLDGQPTGAGFFDQEYLTNRIPVPKKWLLRRGADLLALIGKEGPNFIPVNELVDRDRNGNVVRGSKRPDTVFYVPTAQARKLFPKGAKGDFRQELIDNIPAGTPLYDVYANEKAGGARVKVGTIITDSEFVASDFGDKGFFIHHGRDGVLSLIGAGVNFVKEFWKGLWG